MKPRDIAGIVLLASLFVMSSCGDDDDYSVATDTIIKKVETGSATVTAVSATTTGRVFDLSRQHSVSYSVGVVYGTDPDPKAVGSKVQGTMGADGLVTTT